jgi:hypothetical protein
LCLFDRETKSFRRQQPLNTANQRDFYTITDKDGVKSDGVERMFSGLESVACDVITRLDAQSAWWNDEEERASFAIFIAYFFTRTPAFDQEQSAFGEHMYRAQMKANLHPHCNAGRRMLSPALNCLGFLTQLTFRCYGQPLGKSIPNATVTIKTEAGATVRTFIDPFRIGLAFNNLFDNHNIVGVTPASTATSVPNGADQLTLLPGRSIMATLTVGYSPKGKN